MRGRWAGVGIEPGFWVQHSARATFPPPGSDITPFFLLHQWWRAELVGGHSWSPIEVSDFLFCFAYMCWNGLKKKCVKIWEERPGWSSLFSNRLHYWPVILFCNFETGVIIIITRVLEKRIINLRFFAFWKKCWHGVLLLNGGDCICIGEIRWFKSVNWINECMFWSQWLIDSSAIEGMLLNRLWFQICWNNQYQSRP